MTRAPTDRHIAYRAAVLAALAKVNDEFGDLPSEEMLAVMSYLLGQMIALQDQRRFTPTTIMKHVRRNIEAGNRTAVEDLMRATGSHA